MVCYGCCEDQSYVGAFQISTPSATLTTISKDPSVLFTPVWLRRTDAGSDRSMPNINVPRFAFLMPYVLCEVEEAKYGEVPAFRTNLPCMSFPILLLAGR